MNFTYSFLIISSIDLDYRRNQVALRHGDPIEAGAARSACESSCGHENSRRSFGYLDQVTVTQFDQAPPYMSTVMVKRLLKRQKLESRQLDKLAEIYNFLDENGDGCLTPNELSNSIRKYIHKNVEDDDDETKTMDIVDEIGKIERTGVCYGREGAMHFDGLSRTSNTVF